MYEITTGFINALNDAAIVTETDLSGKIVFVNQNFCDISGFSEAELLGETHCIVNSRTHPKQFFEEMWATIKTGKSWFGEICNRKKSGELYWVQATIFAIFDPQTKIPVRYAAIRFDITKRKQAEMLTQRLAENYRNVIEITDGFCHITSSGMFLEVSDGYCQLSGYSREELLGTNLLRLNGDFSLNLFELNTLLQNQGKSIKLQQQRKDGTNWVAEITVSYSTLNDGSLFLFLHDITERETIEKNNQVLRHQVNQMQKLDSIGRLTAGVAHDFNNILAGIFGYNEINKMIVSVMAKSNDKKDLENNFSFIEHGVQRGADLIDKMLTYCGQHNTKKAIEIRSTVDVIQETLKIITPAFTSKFKIELELDEDIPSIQIDSTDLSQLVTNLLINARDAMKPQGGNILLQFKNVTDIDTQCTACAAKVTGDFIVLRVADSGTGIPPDILSKVFDPFFTTKEVGQGTGLGLSVISGIVHNACAHVVVESVIDEGTTFSLLFSN
jgi:PAS domain S-box-containing protein